MAEVPFLKLGHITEVRKGCLFAESVALNGESHDLLEAFAQCAAYHVRYTTGFARQAFLMKVTRFPLFDSPVGVRVAMVARLTGSASDAWAYTVSASLEGREITASLLIGTTPFDDRFKALRLAPYYQEIFSCLMRV